MTIGSFLFFSYFFYPSLSALEIPKRPEGYVSDYAGMISISDRMELEDKLGRFEEETSNQVVVVTFPSLEGESLEDFSIRLAEAWKIGQQEKNNGVILLIFKADRKVRIEVGYGLEGALPDATSKVIIENEIVPAFRDGRFDEGIEKAVDSILAATKGEYKSNRTGENKKEDFFPILFLFLFFLLRSFQSFENLILILIAGIIAFLLKPLFGSYLSSFYWTSLFSIPLIVIDNLIQQSKVPKVLSKKGEEDWKSGRWWGGSQDNDNFGGGSFGGGGGGFGGGGGGFGGGGASGGW